MVTRILNICGLFLGPEEVLTLPGEANPAGYWENQPFVRLNEAILEAIGGAWDVLPEASPGWERSNRLAEHRAQAKELLAAFSGREPWGWKDPRNSLTLPFWKAIIPGLSIVVVVRSPISVSRSLKKRGSSSARFGLGLWSEYYRRLMDASDGLRRVVTHYDSYFFDAESEVRRVTEALGLQWSPDDIVEASRTARPSLRHHLGRAEEPLPVEIATRYDELCAASGSVYASSLVESQATPGRAAEPPRPPDRESELLRLRSDRDRYRLEIVKLSDMQERDRARIAELSENQARYRGEIEKLRALRERERRRIADLTAAFERCRAKLAVLPTPAEEEAQPKLKTPSDRAGFDSAAEPGSLK